jgi:A/G-specific adenine glycosylase
MPWRQTRDPYRIWISEIMLQQTTVATVLDYYTRFIQRFPTVEDLASADLQEVLKMWSGLGYYSRARNAHRAAQLVVERHASRFPASAEQLQSLPGIGRYTSGAIASMAFDQPAAILETNTIRLLSRLVLHEEPIHTSGSQKLLWEVAELLLPKRSGAGLINQALMELGSLVCTPKSPSCHRCPLRQRCRARQANKQDDVPILKLKPTVLPLTHVGLVIANNQGEILLRMNEPGQWWEGLWDLPWIELHRGQSKSLSPKDFELIKGHFRKQHQMECIPVDLLQVIKHSVTRYRIDYHCFAAKLVDPAMLHTENWCWADRRNLPPVTSRFRRIQLP